MTLSLVEGSIAENGGPAQLKVSLSGKSSRPVTATFALSGPPGYRGKPYWTAGTATVRFEKGDNETKTVNVLTPIDDNVYRPGGGQVVISASTGDVGAAGHSGIASPSPVTLTITDNEKPPIFALELERASVDEDGRDVNVFGRLAPGNYPRGQIRIKLKLEPLTGHTVEDSVGFARYGGGDTLIRRARDWGRFGYVRISPTDNERNEIDKQFMVTAEFVNWQPSMGSLPEPVILTIRDDDEGPGPNLRVSIDERRIPKAGGDVTVTARIDTPAAEDTIVQISLHEDARNCWRAVFTCAPSSRETYPDGATITIPAGKLEGTAAVTMRIKPDPTAYRVPLVVQGRITSNGWATGAYRAGLLFGAD